MCEGLFSQTTGECVGRATTYRCMFELAFFPVRCVMVISDLCNKRSRLLDNAFPDFRPAQDPGNTQVPAEKWWASNLKRTVRGKAILTSTARSPGIYEKIDRAADLSLLVRRFYHVRMERGVFVLPLGQSGCALHGAMGGIDSDHALSDRYEPYGPGARSQPTEISTCSNPTPPPDRGIQLARCATQLPRHRLAGGTSVKQLAPNWNIFRSRGPKSAKKPIARHQHRRRKLIAFPRRTRAKPARKLMRSLNRRNRRALSRRIRRPLPTNDSAPIQDHNDTPPKDVPSKDMDQVPNEPLISSCDPVGKPIVEEAQSHQAGEIAKATGWVARPPRPNLAGNGPRSSWGRRKKETPP